jgi:PPOX class probable F420-dependent enzyme
MAYADVTRRCAMSPYAALADHEFALLTTYRRSGEAVSTAMWFALDGDRVVMSTPAGAGKLKRLRHTSRVQIQPCSRRGAPLSGIEAIPGVARIVTDVAERRGVEAALAGRYGMQWRLALGVEKLMARARRRSAPAPRVGIVVTGT